MYKGQLKDFPREVVEKMLERQVEQGNKRNVKVFEKSEEAIADNGGFDWRKTIEGREFWDKVILDKTFSVFFKKYPQTSVDKTIPKISHDVADVIDTKEFEKINQGYAKCDESNECVTTDEEARVEAAKKELAELTKKVEKEYKGEISSLKKQLETSEELYRVLEQRYDESLELCDELKQRIETIDKELDKMTDSKTTAWSLYHAECAKVSQFQAELNAIKIILNKF